MGKDEKNQKKFFKNPNTFSIYFMTRAKRFIYEKRYIE